MLARSGIRAVFTTRNGGVSAAQYRSLNFSYVSGDRPEHVVANRDRALAAIGLRHSAWTGAKQVHGDRVRHVTNTERGRGADSADTTIPDTDALWTDEPGIALAVLTADCVPLLLADPAARRVAAVHAGWRGLVGGVVERAAEAFDDPERIVAIAGPAIGPCCYEVKEDVSDPARERFGDAVMASGNLDLWTAAMIACGTAGIRDVTVAGLCTRCESHRFFSHRAGDAGRQGLLVCVTEQ